MSYYNYIPTHCRRSYKEKIEMHIVRPTLVYQSHKDVSTKTGSMSKSHYTL